MSTTINPRLLSLAADWLDRMSDEYGNHCSNDYTLPADISDEDVAKLADLMNQRNWPNGVPASADPEDIATPAKLRRHATDWIVIGALSEYLREMTRVPR